MKININNCSNLLQRALNEFKKSIPFEISNEGHIFYAIESDKNTIEFDSGKLKVYYNSYHNIFRLFRLFLQGERLSENCSFEKLGVMIDCSRNGVLKIESVKKMIRLLSAMGYNTLQLYTEDTYEVKGEPYFGYMRGRYTKAEIKEIDDYAKMFGIELIPCIQTLAHLNAIFNWKEYANIRDTDDILLIDDQRTYLLIENMFSTLSECFTSRNVNIGMDEAYLVGLGKYLLKNGYTNRFTLMQHHLIKVKDIAQKYGFKLMMWSDMFFRLDNKGVYRPENPIVSESSIKAVPDDISLIYWDYYHSDKAIYDKMFKAHNKFGKKILFAGGAWTWSGFVPHNRLSIEANDSAIKSAKENDITEAFLTLWGDDGAECSPFSVLPTLFDFAEKSYGHFEEKFINRGFEFITKIKFDDYMALDLPNYINPKEQPSRNNPAKYMLYADCLTNFFEKNIDIKDKEYFIKVSKKLRKFEKNVKFGYIFKQLRCLCDVLYEKYDLSNKTRKLYKDGDREGMALLIKNEYKRLLNKLNLFYKANSERWERDNKPFGEEVQDYRIGGLINRVKHIMRILSNYADRKVDLIPELDETVLSFGEGGDLIEKKEFDFNHFHKIYTASINFTD